VKKRGKCEIVPLFDGRVLFFANLLSPHPLPRAPLHKWRGAYCTLPFGERWREARGHSLPQGREEGRSSAFFTLAPMGERVARSAG
jgi:hypothetical protein